MIDQGGHTDTLSNIENINGSKFDVKIDGDDNDNVVLGGEGDDILRGHGGNDTLDAGPVMTLCMAEMVMIY